MPHPHSLSLATVRRYAPVPCLRAGCHCAAPSRRHRRVRRLLRHHLLHGACGRLVCGRTYAHRACTVRRWDWWRRRAVSSSTSSRWCWSTSAWRPCSGACLTLWQRRGPRTHARTRRRRTAQVVLVGVPRHGDRPGRPWPAHQHSGASNWNAAASVRTWAVRPRCDTHSALRGAMGRRCCTRAS